MISNTVCAVGAFLLISMASRPNSTTWIVAPAAYLHGSYQLVDPMQTGKIISRHIVLCCKSCASCKPADDICHTATPRVECACAKADWACTVQELWLVQASQAGTQTRPTGLQEWVACAQMTAQAERQREGSVGSARWLDVIDISHPTAYIWM